MSRGGNNRVRPYMARISIPKEFGEHWRARAKSGRLSGGLPRTGPGNLPSLLNMAFQSSVSLLDGTSSFFRCI